MTSLQTGPNSSNEVECNDALLDQVVGGIGFAGGHMTPFERAVHRSEILSPFEKSILRLGGK